MTTSGANRRNDPANSSDPAAGPSAPEWDGDPSEAVSEVALRYTSSVAPAADATESKQPNAAAAASTAATSPEPHSLNPKKHGAKRTAADAFARYLTSSASGRGASAGWARCPLCPPRSPKVYALGRGVAAHLRAVHTPWNPGRAEAKRRRSAARRRENLARRRRKANEEAAGREETNDNAAGGDEEGKGGEEEETETRIRWDPTPEEMEEWERRVLEITAKVDAEFSGRIRGSDGGGNGGGGGAGPFGVPAPETFAKEDESAEPPAKRRRTTATMEKERPPGPRSGGIRPGYDRNGRRASSYRGSLPPFIRAAADGDAAALLWLARDTRQRAVVGAAGDAADGGGGPTAREAEAEESDAAVGDVAVAALLDARDRNGSTAEHWSAGGGHLRCLVILSKLRQESAGFKGGGKGGGGGSSGEGRRIRRRDGKTALHYAARNGHVHVIDYLLRSGGGNDDDDGAAAAGDGGPRSSSRVSDADVLSGDSTTPLHMACYGGHLPAVRRLVDAHGADPRRVNDWGCGVAHWAAMSIHPDPRRAVELCEYLRKEFGAEFHAGQKQGHTAAHKAAQRRNGEVIRWMARTLSGEGGKGSERERAGRPDSGGNRPSDIWKSVGGEEEFADFLRDEVGW